MALAKAAEAAGVEGLWISDHFHPWNDEQGQSPFVLGVGTGEALNEHGLGDPWPSIDVPSPLRVVRLEGLSA